MSGNTPKKRGAGGGAGEPKSPKSPATLREPVGSSRQLVEDQDLVIDTVEDVKKHNDELRKDIKRDVRDMHKRLKSLEALVEPHAVSARDGGVRKLLAMCPNNPQTYKTEWEPSNGQIATDACLREKEEFFRGVGKSAKGNQDLDKKLLAAEKHEPDASVTVKAWVLHGYNEKHWSALVGQQATDEQREETSEETSKETSKEGGDANDRGEEPPKKRGHKKDESNNEPPKKRGRPSKAACAGAQEARGARSVG